MAFFGEPCRIARQSLNGDWPDICGFSRRQRFETWLYFHEDIYDYAPLFRQKPLLHELYHAVQYENLASFFKDDKQAALAFHNEICQQQSGFAILYARNEVEAEAFAVYALIDHYGRQTITDLGLIDKAQTYMRGYIIVGDRNFPRGLQNTYGDEIENLYPSPESAIARHRSKAAPQ